MAQISFTIPDAILGRVLDGVAASQGYESSKLEGETKGQFAKRRIKEVMKEWVVGSESSTGAVAAGQTAQSEIDIQD